MVRYKRKTAKERDFYMKIIIIRHGDPDYSIDSLTEKGWREAYLLSERISKLHVDDFYCSPLGRAIATAKPTLTKMNREAKTLHWLREFEGKIISKTTGKPRVAWDLPPSDWCNEEICYDKDNWRGYALYEGTSVNDCYDTVKNGVDELLKRYGWERDGMLYRGGEDKTIVLFCHLCLGMTVISHLLGISPIIAQNNFFLAPTSVSTLVTETDSRGGSHFRVVSLGDTSHLYCAGEPMSESGLHPNFNK